MAEFWAARADRPGTGVGSGAAWREGAGQGQARAPDSIEGTVARPLVAALTVPPPPGSRASYGSWISLVPFASDVAADLKAFVRSADAPAVFGTQ